MGMYQRLKNTILGKFFMLFCCLLIFFQNYLFQKILSGILSECQTNWVQIRPDILSGLICVQSVCTDYEQMTLEGNELKVNINTIEGLMTE